MLKENCPRFETCGASLCPLNNLKDESAWYPDEEVCKNSAYSKLRFIQNQKKIAKRAKDPDKYFNFRMLNQNCRITKGIIGLDPEKDEGPQLKKWLTLHPAHKKMSLAQRKIIAERFRKYRQLKKKIT